jgi:hypothetical protein
MSANTVREAARENSRNFATNQALPLLASAVGRRVQFEREAGGGHGPFSTVRGD